ncbi:MAG: FGGY family carbohydrate kinase [Ilumatobacteraceae bacterium]|nr:FGGY family carbohydrate kinase [Ilumatobacteraceae bacterium]
MILVIDVGTTGLRAALVRPDASLAHVEYRAFAPDSPFPGMVEFDAAEMARLVLDAAEAAIAATGEPVTAVGVAAQRASTIVWDRATGKPIGPALGWQDLRTIGECLTARAEHDLALAPNQSATKIGWLLANHAADRDHADLCFGTVDTWVAWTLTGGAAHVTDHTNAAVTGLYSFEHQRWDLEVCALLGVEPRLLPEIVDSTGTIGPASAIAGAPPLAALVGDQQASMVGQGCIEPGRAKVTFGTGGMLDVCIGDTAPAAGRRSDNGTFPIIAWTDADRKVWGVEAIMLSAGTNVEWLCDDMGLIDSPADSHAVANRCDTTDGVVYVPALLGLGTPNWDYGARGTLLGITRGTERRHIVRAVLEGVAHRGADMVAAAETDIGLTIPTLRIDGGMSQNPTFVQALADASGKPVEVSPIVESTTLGAAFLAGVATGTWSSLDDTAAAFSPAVHVEPGDRLDRGQWAEALERAAAWIPELSALDF